MSDRLATAVCEVVEASPTPDEYLALRRAVGWSAPGAQAVARALHGSLYTVCARLGQDTVGMARVVGDGMLTFYIQDVMVFPEQQARGIGTTLMGRLMAWIGAHAAPGAVVGLMAAKGKEGFYARYGFDSRPNDRLGCGMTMFWPAKGHVPPPGSGG